MENQDFKSKYIPAEGPEGLAQVLDDLLLKCNQDPAFKVQQHFIFYKMGSQQSLIKIDMSQQPFHVWYFDLMRRPATRSVKEVIARFLWEKGGEKERFQQETSEG